MDIAGLRRESESGNLIALTILGICYLDGIGVPVNYGEAFRLLSQAAQHRLPRAEVNLARMHAEGLGTPQDPAAAIRLYEHAAKAGEFLAQVALGRIYSQGIGTEANRSLAWKWYAVAASRERDVSDCEELQEAKAYVSRIP